MTKEQAFEAIEQGGSITHLVFVNGLYIKKIDTSTYQYSNGELIQKERFWRSMNGVSPSFRVVTIEDIIPSPFNKSTPMKFVDIVRRSHIESMKSNIESHGVDWIQVQADDKIGIQTMLKEVEGSIMFKIKDNTAIITAALIKNPLKKKSNEKIN